MTGYPGSRTRGPMLLRDMYIYRQVLPRHTERSARWGRAVCSTLPSQGCRYATSLKGNGARHTCHSGGRGVSHGPFARAMHNYLLPVDICLLLPNMSARDLSSQGCAFFSGGHRRRIQDKEFHKAGPAERRVGGENLVSAPNDSGYAQPGRACVQRRDNSDT